MRSVSAIDAELSRLSAACSSFAKLYFSLNIPHDPLVSVTVVVTFPCPCLMSVILPVFL